MRTCLRTTAAVCSALQSSVTLPAVANSRQCIIHSPDTLIEEVEEGDEEEVEEVGGARRRKRRKARDKKT